MTLDRRTSALLIAGGITVLATVLVFALIIPIWFLFSIPSLVGMVAAEAIFFAGLILVGQQADHLDPVFFRSGFITWLGICCGTEFVVSLLSVFLPTILMPWYWAIQIVILVALVIGCGAIWLLSTHFAVDDFAVMRNVSNGKARAETLRILAAKCPDALTKQKMLKFADDIGYADNTEESTEGSQIDRLISEISQNIMLLENEENASHGNEPSVEKSPTEQIRDSQKTEAGEALKDQLTELSTAIEERKAQTKIAKRGGF